MAARNDHKGINALNKSAAKVLTKAYPTEVFYAERVKTKAKNMQAQWRTINQAVTLLRNNGASTTAVESNEGKCGVQLFLRIFDAGPGCAFIRGSSLAGVVRN